MKRIFQTNPLARWHGGRPPTVAAHVNAFSIGHFRCLWLQSGGIAVTSARKHLDDERQARAASPQHKQPRPSNGGAPQSAGPCLHAAGSASGVSLFSPKRHHTRTPAPCAPGMTVWNHYSSVWGITLHPEGVRSALIPSRGLRLPFCAFAIIPSARRSSGDATLRSLTSPTLVPYQLPTPNKYH
jgi:hypothetical protein